MISEEEPPAIEDVVSKAPEAIAQNTAVALGSIPDAMAALEPVPLGAHSPSPSPLSKEAAVAMQVAAVCGVVALGGAAVGLGGASAASFVRVRRSAKALESLFGRVK